MVLLRAIAAPILLMATVVLSFAAALGVSYVVYDVLFGFPGSDPSLPLFAFVFLVALGIDYNIFLMARVREEAEQHGTREGMLRGLAVTGGVITSAGIVLAGTFAVLAVLPLVFLTELGFAIAFGVLLDTFVVRSTLVPALVLDIGEQGLVAVEARPRRRSRPTATPGIRPERRRAPVGFRPCARPGSPSSPPAAPPCWPAPRPRARPRSSPTRPVTSPSSAMRLTGGGFAAGAPDQPRGRADRASRATPGPTAPSRRPSRRRCSARSSRPRRRSR